MHNLNVEAQLEMELVTQAPITYGKENEEYVGYTYYYVPRQVYRYLQVARGWKTRFYNKLTSYGFGLSNIKEGILYLTPRPALHNVTVLVDQIKDQHTRYKEPRAAPG